MYILTKQVLQALPTPYCDNTIMNIKPKCVKVAIVHIRGIVL